VLPGRQVAVESWFDLTGESPVGAKVTVYHKASGAVFKEGNLDNKGLFVFTYAQSEPLRIVVSAGAGHRKELEIPAAELPLEDGAAHEAQPEVPPLTSSMKPGEASRPFADRSARVSIKDVLLGLALLLAAAAFGLALCNARKLRDLRRKT